MNLQKLIWNIAAFNAWRKTDAYDSAAQLQRRNHAAGLSAGAGDVGERAVHRRPRLRAGPVDRRRIPVPRSPSLAFLAIGAFALLIIGDFLGRVLTKGGVFDVTAHNSFAQLLPTFALAMVAVGLSAPAAMSANGFVVVGLA